MRTLISLILCILLGYSMALSQSNLSNFDCKTNCNDNMDSCVHHYNDTNIIKSLCLDDNDTCSSKFYIDNLKNHYNSLCTSQGLFCVEQCEENK